MEKKFEELLKELREVEKSRKDLVLPLDSLIMRDDGTINSRTYGELDPSEATTNKLCSMYQLSNKHMEVLANEGRFDLIAETFNHFLIEDKRKMKLRIVDDNRIKGIVGKNYRPFDDYEMFGLVGDYLNKQGYDYSLEILNKEDEYTRIRFMISDIEKNMGMSHEKGLNNDIVQGGFEITNSEIGLKSMGVNSLLYRQVCTNGMMALVSEEDNKEIFYKRDKDFNSLYKKKKIDLGLSKAIERANNNIILFEKTKNIVVEEPKKEFFKIAKKYNLGVNHVEGIEQRFEKEPQRNMFGVVNALTRYGRDFNKNDYRNRSKFEFIANDVMQKVAA